MEYRAAFSIDKVLNGLLCVGIWLVMLVPPAFFFGLFAWSIGRMLLNLFAS